MNSTPTSTPTLTPIQVARGGGGGGRVRGMAAAAAGGGAGSCARRARPSWRACDAPGRARDGGCAGARERATGVAANEPTPMIYRASILKRGNVWIVSRWDSYVYAFHARFATISREVCLGSAADRGRYGGHRRSLSSTYAAHAADMQMAALVSDAVSSPCARPRRGGGRRQRPTSARGRGEVAVPS